MSENKISNMQGLKNAINFAVGDLVWLENEFDRIEKFRDSITFLTRSEMKNFMKSNGYEKENIDFELDLQGAQGFLNRVENAYFSAIKINHKPLLDFLENLNVNVDNQNAALQEGVELLEDFYNSTKFTVTKSNFFSEFDNSNFVARVRNEEQQRKQYLSEFAENFAIKNKDNYKKLKENYSLEEEAEYINKSLEAIRYLEEFRDSDLKDFKISEFLQPLKINLLDILDLKTSSDLDLASIAQDSELFAEKSSKANLEDLLAAAASAIRIDAKSNALKNRWREIGKYASDFHLGSATQLVARIIKSELKIEEASNENASEKNDIKSALIKAFSGKKNDIAKLITTYAKLTLQEERQELYLAKIEAESLKAVEGFEKISEKIEPILEILNRIDKVNFNEIKDKEKFLNQEARVTEFIAKELLNNGKPVADNLVNLAKMVDDFKFGVEKSKFTTARSRLRSPSASLEHPSAENIGGLARGEGFVRG